MCYCTMDKRQLNEEIVRCRAVVKKARVHAVRKLLKKIHILRSCKNEALREKKLKKAKRLTAEIHIMRKIQLDHVTKFALLNEDYTRVPSNTKQRRKRNACSQLAKTKLVAQRVNEIRSKFVNWKEELPFMLRAESKKDKNEDETADVAKEKEEAPVKSDSDVVVEGKVEGEKTKKGSDSAGDNAAKKSEKQGQKVKKKKVKAPRAKDKNGESGSECKTEKRSREKESDEAIESEAVAEEKVDDPFFIGKKVIAPTLSRLGNEDGDKKEQSEDDSQEKAKMTTVTTEKKRKRERKSPEPEAKTEELHPSWKAKKIQMIRPFEGKKIVFE